MRLLVTGGCGYVGSSLVPALVRAGHEVTVLDRMVFGDGGLRHQPGVELVAGDVRDEPLVRTLLRGRDALVHLAYVSNDPEFELDPAVGWSINVGAFRMLVEAAIHAGVARFVFPSSCSIYGKTAGSEVLDEDAAVAPLTDYARAKVACEAILREHGTDALCWTVIRPATLCGLSPRQRLDLTVNRFIASAYYQRRITVREPERRRPYVHMEDLVRLYLQILEADADSVRGAVFNVAYGNHTVGEMAQQIAAQVGAEVELRPEPFADGRSYRVSTQRLQRALGFAPRMGIDDATRALCAAFERGALPGAPDDERYYNLPMQKQVIW